MVPDNNGSMQAKPQFLYSRSAAHDGHKCESSKEAKCRQVLKVTPCFAISFLRLHGRYGLRNRSFHFLRYRTPR